MIMLQHYKIYGGMPGVFEYMGRGIISSRPGMLKGGFMEEACPQFSLQAKIGISQAKEKEALRQKEPLEQRQERQSYHPWGRANRSVW